MRRCLTHESLWGKGIVLDNQISTKLPCISWWRHCSQWAIYIGWVYEANMCKFTGATRRLITLYSIKHASQNKTHCHSSEEQGTQHSLPHQPKQCEQTTYPDYPSLGSEHSREGDCCTALQVRAACSLVLQELSKGSTAKPITLTCACMKYRYVM